MPHSILGTLAACYLTLVIVLKYHLQAESLGSPEPPQPSRYGGGSALRPSCPILHAISSGMGQCMGWCWVGGRELGTAVAGWWWGGSPQP